jgi:hypothetical protein
LRFEDAFAAFANSQALFTFLALIEEEREVMEAVISKKSGLEETGLEVVR